MPLISIICPVHNGLDYTKKCLKSLFVAVNSSRYKDNISIIIVDDGSTDGTADWVNERYPKIKVLKGNGNLWWSGAVNLAAKYAVANGTEYILLINNDNIFSENFLDEIVLCAVKNNLNIVGSKLHVLGSDEIWEMGGYFNGKSGKYGAYKDVMQLKRNKRISTNCYRVDWLGGMGTLIHRSVFEKIGYWDEINFPQYYGDVDFILRAKRNGIEAYVCLDSIIWNDVENTGMLHGGSFIKLIKTLTTRKSIYWLRASLALAVKHNNNSIAVIRFLTRKYGRYIGGFFKHKVIFLYKNVLEKFGLMLYGKAP